MIDVHIILPEKYNKEWLNCCLESLENEPIRIHFVDAIEGNVGAARKNGFQKGVNEWVAFVDYDDVVEKGIFSLISEHLSDQYSAVYTNHSIVKEGQHVSNWFREVSNNRWRQLKQMHHIVVYNREIITPVLSLLDGMVNSEIRILNAQCALEREILGIDKVGYYWRIHENSSHKKYRWFDNPKKQRKWLIEKEGEIIRKYD